MHLVSSVGPRPLDGKIGRRGLYALPMGRYSNSIHVWNSLLERAGFPLADIPKQWDAFWSFWCDRHSQKTTLQRIQAYLDR